MKTLESQDATYLIGFEQTARPCGSSSLSQNSILIFVEEEKKIVIPNLITLFPGAKYMIIYEPNSPVPCTYFSKASDRVIGVAKPTPETTPEIAETPVSQAPKNPPTVGAGSDNDDDDIPLSTSEITTGEPTTDDDDDGLNTPIGGGIIGNDADVSAEPSATEEEEDDGSVCFPASASVELENGETKTMDKVNIGDKVKVSNGLYSEVFMFTHKMADIKSDFVNVETTSGVSLKLTKGHFLYVNGAMTAAKTIKVGDSLELGNGGSTVVTSVSMEQSTGLYNPQTVHGDIIVNGVRVSTYTTTVEPMAAHSLLAPFRALFFKLNLATMLFDNGADELAKVCKAVL